MTTNAAFTAVVGGRMRRGRSNDDDAGDGVPPRTYRAVTVWAIHVLVLLLQEATTTTDAFPLRHQPRRLLSSFVGTPSSLARSVPWQRPEASRHRLILFRRHASESSSIGDDEVEENDDVEAEELGPVLSSSDDRVDNKNDDDVGDGDNEDDGVEDDFVDQADSLLLDQDESSMGAWVPVGSISCLKGLDPTPLEIMGRPFVVWEGAGGQWSVLKDECPHRSVPLSQGRVDPTSKCLECAFHGWQFASNGTLVRIPHLEAGQDVQAGSRSVDSYATHVTGDLLWVFLPTPFHGESFPRSLLPEDYYHGLQSFVKRKATYYTQEMPFSFDFFIENVLDGPAHAYFAHNAFGFRREEALPLPVRIPVSNFTELMTEVSYRRQGRERRRRYGFQRPFMAMNQQPLRNGDWRTAIIFFAVPIREGFTRLITTFDTLSPHPLTPDWVLHIINQKFLEGDFIVHSAEVAIRKQLALAQFQPKYIYATSSDTSVKAWRSWWTKYGLSAAPPHTFGPASPQSLQLLDRQELGNAWRYHTRHCSKCRTALRRSKVAQHVGAVLAWSALALFRRNRVLACIVALVGACLRWGASRLVRELEGPSSRSDVGDRSLSASL